MSYTNISPSLHEEVIQKAVRIGKLAEEQAQQADLNSTISPELVALMREEQIHRYILPKEYGYPQLSWHTFVEFVATVGYHNLSAAWLAYFFSVHNAWVNYLPKHVREEVIASEGLVADVFAPIGKMEPTEGGYLLSGTYHLVSGINYCEWVGVGVMMQFDDSPTPERVGVLVNVKDIEIKQNWNALGLRGSGSQTIIIDNVFVKPDAILRFSQMIARSQPPEADTMPFDEDYLYYNTPFYPGFYVGFAAMAVGGARRVVAEYTKYSAGRVRMTGIKETDNPGSQRLLAELSIELEAVEALMKQYVAMMEQDKGGPYDGARYKAIRSSIIRRATEMAFKAQLSLGGFALLKGNATEMVLRDLITISGHITSLYDDALMLYGRSLFGFDQFVQG